MSDWTQVGTVEILRTRVYPIDPNSEPHPLETTVLVEPGAAFPVYRRIDAYCWVMQGRINQRVAKIGNGLFEMNGGDTPGLEVQFPSRTYGSEAFAELLADRISQEGPEQRLRFVMTESADHG
ncbi:hypothetical protein PP298_08130 [Mycobacteroides abscessus]|uniref:hypothetical protein n=1 Tax=Mycobacteroides abscessus TaxID=36809 RepID=UPI00078CB76C|nr:hypothetical protein [Mycobacteroides abscessus]AMU71464.1 hypothetical protein A3O05_16505 [Mycobacteroides abscessus]MDM2015309.1 hypothetical protein [Mycobacteroides abscessus]MDM2019687.1 hypothetical protein [Mycobacteroides abscessus]MDM2025104.1 hypothetical protein [Mycobacteroides abscessus]MDM2027775.1 hypothetical protein [Mycobacteroides abscessus]